MDKPLFNRRYDISNNGILRLIKHLIINRFSLVGNIFGNPGVKYLLVLVVLHYFGRPLYWFASRWERPFRFLLSRLRRS